MLVEAAIELMDGLVPWLAAFAIEAVGEEEVCAPVLPERTAAVAVVEPPLALADGAAGGRLAKMFGACENDGAFASMPAPPAKEILASMPLGNGGTLASPLVAAPFVAAALVAAPFVAAALVAPLVAVAVPIAVALVEPAPVVVWGRAAPVVPCVTAPAAAGRTPLASCAAPRTGGGGGGTGRAARGAGGVTKMDYGARRNKLRTLGRYALLR